MIRIAILAPPGFAFAMQFAAAIRPVIRSRARRPELTFETRRRYNTVKRSPSFARQISCKFCMLARASRRGPVFLA